MGCVRWWCWAMAVAAADPSGDLVFEGLDLNLTARVAAAAARSLSALEEKI